MSFTFGANEACLCGSGKHYTLCCGAGSIAAAFAAPTGDSHDGAVGLALAWLTERHRKGFKTAFERLVDAVMGPLPRSSMAELGEETLGAVQINLTEWLLAEGEIWVRGEMERINDLLVGERGPQLNTAQRAWIAKLGAQPLRLYTVTDVRTGEGLTLCDALDAQAPPVIVRERSGSRNARAGLLLGCRVMPEPHHNELAGSMQVFSPLAGPRVLARMGEALQKGSGGPVQAAPPSLIILQEWLRQFVEPPAMPTMIDAHSGDPIQLITDHYRVLDWPALAQALRACADVQGSREKGWNRLLDGDDGQQRSLAAINLSERPDCVEIFYRAQRMAETGRVWFDALAGGMVTFIERQAVDAKQAAMPEVAKAAAGNLIDKLSPADRARLAEAYEQMMKRVYANWGDEAIPALDGKTPREAMQSPAGLERVKGLLRSYEADEARMAQQQGRGEISFAFLWERLGLTR